MTKKIARLDDWISAQDAAHLLSLKMGRRINPEYMTKLAKSKRQPVRTRSLGCHKLYCKEDILACNVRAKEKHPLWVPID